MTRRLTVGTLLMVASVLLAPLSAGAQIAILQQWPGVGAWNTVLFNVGSTSLDLRCTLSGNGEGISVAFLWDYNMALRFAMSDDDAAVTNDQNFNFLSEESSRHAHFTVAIDATVIIDGNTVQTVVPSSSGTMYFTPERLLAWDYNNPGAPDVTKFITNDIFKMLGSGKNLYVKTFDRQYELPLSGIGDAIKMLPTCVNALKETFDKSLSK